MRDRHTARMLNSWLAAGGFGPYSDQNFTLFRKNHYPDWLKEQAHLDDVRRRTETIRRELDAGGFSVIDKVVYEAAEALSGSDADPIDIARSVAALKSVVVQARTQERRLALDERRVEIAADQADLARERFQRETVELFLRWRQDQRAVEIADRPGLSSDERTELLGKALFGDDWK
jgi:hypothetical protein